MKKKVIMGVFVLIITVAMVAAATMAWFTDFADSGEATFSAGTVAIEAGRKIIYDGGDEGESAVRKEIYPFRVLEARQGKAGINKDLPVKQARSNEKAVLSLETGRNESNFYSLGFGGEMILEFDHALYKPEIAIIVEDTWGGNYPLETADVFVSMDGVVWHSLGTADNRNLQKNQTYSEFLFSDYNVDIDYIKYVKVVDTTDVNQFIERGYKSNDNSVDGFDLNTVKLIGYIAEEENWNPGDTNYTRYTIINTGTKAINLRAKLTGGWYKHVEDDFGGKWVPDDELSSDNVVITPEGDDWVYEDGYLYYRPVIPGTYTKQDVKDRTAELKASVHLKGKETGNEYQGKRFIITAEFEAVQASNNAPKEVWNVDLY